MAVNNVSKVLIQKLLALQSLKQKSQKQECSRTTQSTYEQLLGWLALLIPKEATKMRESIGASERLSVTLRYCVTGDAQTTIVASYRTSRSTLCRIIAETSNAIWTVIIREGFLTCPSMEKEQEEVSQSFENKWNFPHARVALDNACNMSLFMVSSKNILFSTAILFSELLHVHLIFF